VGDCLEMSMMLISEKVRIMSGSSRGIARRSAMMIRIRRSEEHRALVVQNALNVGTTV
jgi:hypothetical protein